MNARNWVSALLGLWFAISPWALGMQHDNEVVQSSVLVGVIQIIASVWATRNMHVESWRSWPNWIAFACGLWFTVHPFLGHFEEGPYWAIIVPAIVTMALNLWALMINNQHSAGPKTPA